MAPYEKLRAWQAAHDVVLRIYRETETWPKREIYGLTAQARRAAFSVAANIAEGSAKRGPRELRRYLDISLGSFAELRYAVRLARELGYLTEDGGNQLTPTLDTAGKRLWAFYRTVSKLALRHSKAAAR